jgi:DNA-binding NtrC family response regulator
MRKAAFDSPLIIKEARMRDGPMNIKLELPQDLFDERFPEAKFVERVRELALLELLRARRMHEHEIAEMLGCERWELVEKMKAVGIAPTEDVFKEIRGGLNQAIAARREPNLPRKK